MKLEEQLRAAEETLKYKKRQVQELQQDLQVISIYSQYLILNQYPITIRTEVFVLHLEYILQRSAYNSLNSTFQFLSHLLPIPHLLLV